MRTTKLARTIAALVLLSHRSAFIHAARSVALLGAGRYAPALQICS